MGIIDQERLDKGLYWQRAWKLVEGCTKVSPGCDNCWSEQETVMRAGHPNDKIRERARSAVHLAQIPGDVTMFDGTIICREDNLDLPLRTKKPTVWAIWNDLYHEDVPDDFRDRAYAVMALCPQHTFLILTKRAERMARYWLAESPAMLGLRWWKARKYTKLGYSIAAHDCGRWCVSGIPNVWHGVTAESQEQADARIPHLLNVPGRRFLSVEPMLGAVDLPLRCQWDHNNDGDCHVHPQGCPPNIHAVILGGESGKNARPMHPQWVRDVRDQCAAAGVSFYFKQWGEWAEASNGPKPNDRLLAVPHPVYPDCGIAAVMRKVGKKKAGRTLDGHLHDDLPWKENDHGSTATVRSGTEE